MTTDPTGSYEPTMAGSAAVAATGDDRLFVLAEGESLADVQFLRVGTDLEVVTGDAVLVVEGYFASSPPPDLVTVDGQSLPGALVESAARTVGGPYAQATGGAAADPIGSVEDFEGAVFATRADGARVTLTTGDPVFRGDLIETEDAAAVRIEFADGTTFALSDSARMVLDEAVYDPGTGTGSFVASVVRGTFVFFTGLIAGTAPDAMQVQTPAGVLGIRGTTAGCAIDAGGGTTACSLLVDADGHVGELAFSNAAETVVIDQPFETVIATGSGAALRTSVLPAEQVRSLLSGALGDGGLPDSEAGLLVPNSGAGFFQPESGSILAIGLAAPLGPTGPLGNLMAPSAPPTDSLFRETFVEIIPEEPAPRQAAEPPPEPVEPPPPPPPPPPLPEPTMITPAESVAAAPLRAVAIEHDFGDLVAFPALTDGTDLFASPLFARVGLGVFGDADALTFGYDVPEVTVTFIGENGEFQSTLGYYLIDAAGVIGPPQLIATNLSEIGGGGDVAPGTNFVLDNGGNGFDAGTTLGLFLLADGYALNPALQTPEALTLALAFEQQERGGRRPNLVDVGDAAPLLVIEDPIAGPIPLTGRIWHTAAHFEGLPVAGDNQVTAGLNDDQPGPTNVPEDADGDPINQHHVVGSAPQATRVGFEDLLLDGGDRDFEDVLLDITIPNAATAAMPVEPLPFGFKMENQGGELIEMAVVITNPAPGDRLTLGGDFAVGPDGAISVEGKPLGVTFGQIVPSEVRFLADDGQPISRYSELVNALELTTDQEQPTAGTRLIDLLATDPAGVEGSLQVRFVVPDGPTFGTDGDDQIAGDPVNDALFGLAGDDQLAGRAGDDILVGGAGNDTVRGGTGGDFFRIDSVAEIDADSDGVVDFVDQLVNFDPSQGDRIDLTELLAELGATHGVVDRFLNVVDGAEQTVRVQVDPAGQAGTGANGWQTIITVTGPGSAATVGDNIVEPV